MENGISANLVHLKKKKKKKTTWSQAALTKVMIDGGGQYLWAQLVIIITLINSINKQKK